MYVVSNTEVSTHNLCEKQHSYRFVENIEPRYISLNTPLGIGILGHSALEAYYLELKDGHSVDQAYKAAHNVLVKEAERVITETPEEFTQLGKIAHLQNLLEAYSEYYRVEPFRVLEIEKVYQTPINDDILYSLRLDLLVEWLTGINRGEAVIIDHKFVYNFKSRADLEMDCQLPKYTKTLRDNGVKVYRSYFNQIRYREMKNPGMSDLFLRTPMESNQHEIDTIWKEQKEVAEKIVLQHYSIQKSNPVRTQHILTCRRCLFQGLCKTELMGNDTTQMRVANYKPSEYGYVDLMEEGIF